MSKVHDFKEQLEVGNIGEEAFEIAYPEFKRVGGGRKHDLINAKGEKVEVKTESRSLSATKNILRNFGKLWMS
jgi:hypothetical protein